VESSVPPARLKYYVLFVSDAPPTSPPDKDVGIVIRGTVGSAIVFGASELSTE